MAFFLCAHKVNLIKEKQSTQEYSKSGAEMRVAFFGMSAQWQSTETIATCSTRDLREKYDSINNSTGPVIFTLYTGTSIDALTLGPSSEA